MQAEALVPKHTHIHKHSRTTKQVRTNTVNDISSVLLLVLSCLVCNCCWLDVFIFVVVSCVFSSSYVYLLNYVCCFTLDTGLLARSQVFLGFLVPISKC